MGSGKLVKRAIKKYGIENFTKEILFVFDTKEEMDAKEKELVVISEQTYNLVEGGHGGFGYINKNGLKASLTSKRAKKMWLLGKEGREQFWLSEKGAQLKLKLRDELILRNKLKQFNYGKPCSETAKVKIGNANSFHQQGIKNSQYGTRWINNGLINKKLRKNQIKPDDWFFGRI